MVDRSVGIVLAIAVRSCVNGPMKEINDAELAEGGGIKGDVPSRPDRGVTLISAKQWEEVTDELGVDHPWHTRRANLLVDAPFLNHLIGKSIRLGSAVIQIVAESTPCDLMDRLHPGLRQALAPEYRGGVYGRIIQAGHCRVGDIITLMQ